VRESHLVAFGQLDLIQTQHRLALYVGLCTKAVQRLKTHFKNLDFKKPTHAEK